MSDVPRPNDNELLASPAESGWYTDQDRAHLVRLYCAGCETYSRPVLKPTEADTRRISDRLVRDLVTKIHERQTAEPASDLIRAAGNALYPVVFPDPPKGWENGCPRCCRV